MYSFHKNPRTSYWKLNLQSILHEKIKYCGKNTNTNIFIIKTAKIIVENCDAYNVFKANNDI